MTVKIVTDSTCDLPDVLITRHKITVVPLFVNIDDNSYLDGVDISRSSFYRRLPGWNPPPTTAAPSPERFRRAYQGLLAAETAEILSIHVAAELSGTIGNARFAAEQVDQESITVLDSRQLSLGTGFLVLAAAQAASKGKSVAEIVPRLKDQIKRTHLFAALDTLEFLRRSGRVNRIAAGLGSMLQIKPLLKMHDGTASSERVRTTKRARQRLVELLAGVSPLEQVALIHTSAPERVEELRQAAAHLLPPGEPIEAEVTPVIGSHVGPGAVGFVAISAKQR